ncbi:MAG: GTPase Era [Gammaproteobacteria bacterium]|nr:GTPase Era [Planctomycetaceae bacterium]MCB1671019.1 GTPase Era [Pseudomonadales bacterium]MCP5346439.1 GTPase Era [Pseudomonadales bacterium]
MSSDTGKIRDRRCGFIALVGRPNVGKSTLLNHFLRQKISITSRKPQTTRHRILGVHTTADAQFIYVDTPGLHHERGKTLNRIMNETVERVIADVDVVFFVVERLAWTDEDELVLTALNKVDKPVLLLINKVDQIQDKTRLLPHLQALAGKREFAEIIPVSALKGHNLEVIDEVARKYLPEGDFLFPEDQVTDRSSRFLAAELIREKITRQLGDELPYEVTVEIETFKESDGVLHVDGLILVEKTGQKQILIGRQGSRLKLIGSEARQDMEKAFDSKVMLQLWVKVKTGWADDERALQSLGYTDDL